VDPDTLRHRRFSNVFACGSCAAIPTTTSPASAYVQSQYLAANLSSAFNRRPLVSLYDGYTALPSHVENERVILAESDYSGQRIDTFPFDQTVPSFSLGFLFNELMPIWYWNRVLQGVFYAPSSFRDSPLLKLASYPFAPVMTLFAAFSSMMPRWAARSRSPWPWQGIQLPPPPPAAEDPDEEWHRHHDGPQSVTHEAHSSTGSPAASKH